MSKKTIVIGTLSSLLVIGGVATTAGLLLSNAKIGTGEDITNRNTIITRSNIEDLLNSLQTEINKNELTRTQFASQNFADIVKNNLKAGDKNIGHLIIEDGIRLTNGGNQIQVSLNPRIQFQLDGIISADNLASYDSSNKILTLNISNLKYFSAYDVTVLNNLYNELNDYIIDQTRLFTSSEFLNYVETNNESIKQLVAKYLTFSASKTREINFSEIKSVVFKETANQLEITLNSDYRKYNLEPSNNITLTGNNIINVINFTFYQSSTISNTKLMGLESEIQSYINDSNNMYTIEQFNSQITTSNFKNKIANYLSIPTSSINTISYTNNKLLITPVSMHKFVNDSDVIIGNVEVSNLRFYLSESLMNLDELYNAFNNYIINTTRKYTIEEFSRYISVDSANAKQLVADNLYISDTQKIDVNQITNIEFDANDNANILKITLDNNYRKYNLVPTNNVTLNQNVISVSNFTFYTAYQTTDAKLSMSFFSKNVTPYVIIMSP